MNCCPIHLAYLGRGIYASLKERAAADKVPHGTPLSTNEKCTVDFLILAGLGVGLNRSKRREVSESQATPIIIEPVLATEKDLPPFELNATVQNIEVHSPPSQGETVVNEELCGLQIIEPRNDSNNEEITDRTLDGTTLSTNSTVIGTCTISYSNSSSTCQ